MSTPDIPVDTGSNAAATVLGRIGNYRWVICALLFFSTTMNYIDRNSLSVLKTTLQHALGFTEVDYGWITFAFTASYAMFPSLIGVFVDRFGVKKSLAIALVLWSIAAAAHGLVATVIGFAIMRFLLGIAEAANFPASIKAVAMWFPQRERALATGIFNSGTSVGVMVSFATVWLAETYGWQSAFISTGMLGLVWLVFWQKWFNPPETSPRVGPAELAFIKAGQPPAEKAVRVPWTALLRYREIWPFLIGKLITDPVWWFYLFWLPSYLERERGQNPLKSALLIGVIYTGSSVGSILGGWFSGYLMRRGWHVGKARMTTMFIAALFMPGSIFAYYAESFTVCVAFITLATACHQAWSANIFTSATDLFPPKVSGSVVGLGATAGGIGGMFMTLLVALAVQATGNQQMVFIAAGVMHMTSLLIFWLWFRGRLDPVDVSAGLDMRSRHGGLVIGGIVIGVLGALGIALILHSWDDIIAVVRKSGGAQALTVGAAFIIIGAALLYAGLPKKTQLVI
jgi:MFS transporter, ACS family, hexuronate transporter